MIVRCCKQWFWSSNQDSRNAAVKQTGLVVLQCDNTDTFANYSR